MRRLTSAMLLACVILSSVLLLCACAPSYGSLSGDLQEVQLPPLKDNQFVVVIKESENNYTYYTMTITDLGTTSTVLDALLYLEKNKELTLDYYYSSYGAYFTQIGNLHDGDGGRYIMFYTSVEQDFDTSAYATTFNCGGVNVTSSGVGASSMHVQGGAVIYIQLTAF